ncbi:MAG: hypothetical protein U0M60_21830, partial [Clostridia bacterium]|nr:hypothetical protein [Clostridia bacterium]
LRHGNLPRAKNSPPDCFLYALTVLQALIAYGISAVRTTLAVCSRISLTENSPKNSLSYIQKLCYGRAFCFS